MTAFDNATFDTLISASPTGHTDARKAAFEVFDTTEMPTEALEDWRYVNLDLDLDDLTPATEAGEPISDGRFMSTLGDRPRITIIDGIVTAIDDTDVEVHRLAELDTLPMRAAEPERNKLSAAAAAFGTDGVWVRVPDNHVSETPLIVDMQSTQTGVISFPRLVVELGSNSEAAVILVHRGETSTHTVPDVFLDVGDGARLRFLEVQGFGAESVGVVHQRVRIGRDGNVRLGEVGLGGRIGRLDITIEMEGNGSSSEVIGVFFGERDQTMDYRMVMNHIGRNTSSDVFLKGAVEDEAQSVFTGLLRIEEDAAGTSAFETNRNLVLSDGAKAHSVPNLEILNNDVICGHGSSVGPLEEANLYYLMSRGLSRERAERLLMKGFFREAMDRLPITEFNDLVEGIFTERFIRASQESAATTSS
ncbi:MAG: Fe-S cluster assembly protein SufD [Acidimicrobiia bacterium]|nr:Fe-S cluster assembly protein SufD [Acidimicrobiia bacterium]